MSPARTMIGGRTAEGALQRCYTSIDGARAQAWHLGESILGSGTEGFAIGSGKWTSEATNQRIRIGIIDNGGGHGRQIPAVGSYAVLRSLFLL
jgi:hypothetical protein